MWLSRDLDMERARTADLSMSINRSTLDPYGQNTVRSGQWKNKVLCASVNNVHNLSKCDVM